MTHDFDRNIDRHGTNSVKWKHYAPDVLPLWVADMDFAAPEPVQKALRDAVAHGIYGYEFPSKELREIVAARMDNLYGWKVSPDMVVATPGVIAGFTAAAQAVCTTGEGILVQPPVYPPFLGVHNMLRACPPGRPLKSGIRWREPALPGRFRCLFKGNQLGRQADRNVPAVQSTQSNRTDLLAPGIAPDGRNLYKEWYGDLLG